MLHHGYVHALFDLQKKDRTVLLLIAYFFRDLSC